jgi:hypothetical protein
MKKVIGVLALLVLLAALGAGGFYVSQGRLPWERPPAPAPQPVPAPAAPAPPAELPPPTLVGEQPPAAAPAGQQVATLAGFERTVKAKRASELAWDDAKPQMPLYDSDAVRTFDKASASIAFGPNDVVEVDQNSLVIIKPRSPQAQENEISLALLSADLLKSLEARPAAEQSAAIAAAAKERGVTIRPVAPPGGKPVPTRVALKVMPDRTTSVAAISGSLRVVGPKGNEVVLKEKQATRITAAGLVVQPRVLPSAPELVFPQDGATYPFLRKAPHVEMTWKPVAGAKGYRVVMSTDPGFKRVFADERAQAASLDVRSLQPGTYYWRVRAQDADGFEGPYSPVRTVRAVFDDTPPPLAITAPPEMYVSPGSQVTLKGKTESDARVKVNGSPAKVGPDGTFTFDVTLKEGVNLVTVEAVDPAGNAEYGKRLITYKGTKRTGTASVSGNR